MISRLPMGLLVVILVLTGVLFFQVVAPVAPIAEPALSITPGAAARVALPVFTPPPQEQFAVINARAAFDPARQAVAELPPITDSPAAAAPQVTLVGVILGGSDAVALLLKADGQTISVRPGQSVDGWQIVRIALGQVVFRAGTRDYTVTLRAAAGAAQPPLSNNAPPPATEKPAQ